jgi:hypothetical protein
MEQTVASSIPPLNDLFFIFEKEKEEESGVIIAAQFIIKIPAAPHAANAHGDHPVFLFLRLSSFSLN